MCINVKLNLDCHCYKYMLPQLKYMACYFYSTLYYSSHVGLCRFILIFPTPYLGIFNKLAMVGT